MMKTALQRRDAALARAQELLELVEQGRERLQDAFVIFDFVIEIELAAVTLAAREPAARIGAPAEQPVEIGELRGTETFGETGARQAHEFAERAHAHGEPGARCLLRASATRRAAAV